MDDNVQTAVGEALMACEHFGKKAGDANYVDLADFADQLDLDDRLSVELQDEAWDVVTAVSDVRIDYRSGTLNGAAEGLSIYFPSAQTVSGKHTKLWSVDESPYDAPMKPTEDGPDDAWVKYGPDTNPATCTAAGRDGDPVHPLPNAPGFDFVDDTAWNEMLMRFYEPVADAECFPRLFIGGGTTVCHGDGSSDFDGEITDYYWDGDGAVDDDDADGDEEPARRANLRVAGPGHEGVPDQHQGVGHPHDQHVDGHGVEEPRVALPEQGHHLARLAVGDRGVGMHRQLMRRVLATPREEVEQDESQPGGREEHECVGVQPEIGPAATPVQIQQHHVDDEAHDQHRGDGAADPGRKIRGQAEGAEHRRGIPQRQAGPQHHRERQRDDVPGDPLDRPWSR